jgi:selenocysteine-specific elongation factor
VHLHLLPAAPRPLRQDDALDLFVGSAERRVRVTLLEAENLAPGETGWVLLRLRTPAVAVRGDRFIVRWPSPGVTVGGGVVVDPHPGRLRRFRPEVVTALEALERGRPEDVLLQVFRGQPRQMRQLVEESGLEKEEVEATVQQLLQERRLIALQAGQGAPRPTTLLLPRGEAERLHERLFALLGEYHVRFPLRSGMPKEELKSQLRLEGRVLNDVLAWAEGDGSLVVQGALVRRAEHRLRFSPEQQAQVDHLLRVLRRQPYAPPPRREWGIDPEVLDALVEEGRIVRLTADVIFTPDTYEEMVQAVLERIDREGPVTVAQVRDIFDTSRKFALALLEDMDGKNLTRRVGDERVRS